MMVETQPRGEVREWLNRAVSKTVEPLRVPWVRIPPSPPKVIKNQYLNIIHCFPFCAHLFEKSFERRWAMRETATGCSRLFIRLWTKWPNMRKLKGGAGAAGHILA
jgi:hypothetical protein